MTVTRQGPGVRTPVASRRNRVHWFAGRSHDVLDDIGQAATWALTPAERGEAIAELLSLRSRIDALLAGLMADADRADDAADAGATNTAAWVRTLSGITGAEATRLVKQATTLEAHPATLSALAEGLLHTRQATEIAAAVDALPDEVADQCEAAEQHLLGVAGEHDAKALRTLGRHLLEVIAPDRADELIARKLEQEEREAARACALRTWRDGHGSIHGRFTIPARHGAILTTMIDAVANPTRPHPIPREGVASAQVDGQAFCELLERYPVDRLPTHGGLNATIVVTLSLETLLGGLQAAQILGTGELISPALARRLACEAGVIPAVLGGKSEVLDLGRRRRFHTRPQRLALALQQHGLCNVADCDRPASWADAHHRKPWAEHGPTSVTHGELICTRHHTLVHQGHSYPRRT